MSKILVVSGAKSGKRGITIYPWINLRGAWLARLGWFPGDKIEVKANEKRVTITKI